MATFRLTDFIMYNSYNNITGVSWEVSTDSDFNNIIDKVYNSKEHIIEWFSRLDKPDGSGQYGENDILYVRCKVHVNTSSTNMESKWYTKIINNNEKIKTILINDYEKVIGEIDVYPDGSKVRIW